MVSGSRPIIIIGAGLGMRAAHILAASAGLGGAVAGHGFTDGAVSRPGRSQERQRLRAEERRERKRSDDEFREHLLRQRIAEGKDERADKYLHASARRRRQAERDAPSAPSPSPEARR